MADADSETLSSPLLPAGKQRRPPTTTGIWRWRREALAGSGVVGRGAAAGAMRMRLRSLLAAAVAVTVCALVFTSGLLSRDGLVDSRSPSPLRGFGDALNRASSSFAGIGRGLKDKATSEPVVMAASVAAAARDGPSLSEVRQRRKMFPEVDGGVGERAKGEEVDDAKLPSPLKSGSSVGGAGEAAAAKEDVHSSVPREMNDPSGDEAAEIKRVLVDQAVQKTVAARRKMSSGNNLFAMKHGMPLPRRRVRKRPPTPKPLFSFAEVKLKGPSRNPAEFAVEYVKLRLQAELGKGGAKALNLNETWSPVKKRVSVKAAKGSAAPVNKLVVGRGDLKVGDEVPAINSRQVLVATTWRSGSSFFGELLAHYPGVYYSYEPLHANYFKKEFNNETVASAATLVSSLFKCDYNDVVLNYLKHSSKTSNNFLFHDNFRVWSTCQNLLPAKSACFLPLFYKAVCPLFPVRIVKTVRMRVKETEALLRDPGLANLKVVVLLRDPRGVMNSRATMDWCLADRCANAEVVCDHLDRDLKSAFDLRKRYPGRVHLIRYEDLSTEPFDVVDELFDFLDLPPSPLIDHYIETHTNSVRLVKSYDKKSHKTKERVNPYSKYRDSKVTAVAWRGKMDMSYIERIQKLCAAPMRALGYNPLAGVRERDDDAVPLVVKDRHEVWPLDRGS